MLKTRLLLLLLCAGLFASAQVDSTAKKDTSIIDEVKDGLLDNIPTVSLDENDLGDGGNQNISSLLTAGRDPFYSAASFNFSAVRFRIRGYDNDHFSTFMNGIPMDNLDNGFTPFGLWVQPLAVTDDVHTNQRLLNQGLEFVLRLAQCRFIALARRKYRE